MFVYILLPLASISYNLVNRPMNTKLLNFMENMNESFLLYSGYFLTIFTQWICDPVIRYNLGYIYLAVELLILATNLVIITYEMSKAVIKENKRRIWLKEWNIYFKNIHDKETEALLLKQKKK